MVDTKSFGKNIVSNPIVSDLPVSPSPINRKKDLASMEQLAMYPCVWSISSSMSGSPPETLSRYLSKLGQCVLYLS